MSESYTHGMSDADVAEFNYATSGFDRAFKLGAYEPDYLIDNYLQNGSYEIGDQHMYIADPVWGNEVIGDQPFDALLIELARTPLFRRLQSIEQLTLGPDYATMPNSMYFSRWQHLWGSVVFVRKMLEGRDDITPRDQMVLQLRTLLSDAGQTAFSHLGDWIFQGASAAEDLHDQELKTILQISGIDDTLQDYGFSLEETVFPDIEDWVECPLPDLCVDRVDYGVREILRWGSPTIPLNMVINQLHNPQSIFEIAPDGKLLMKDPMIARWLAAGFGILPTEHWAHPVHRLQLSLMQDTVKQSLLEKVVFSGEHPREALYGVDSDHYPNFHMWESLHLHHIMKSIGRAQREIFTNARRADLNSIFSGIYEPDWKFPEFPDPLKSYTWQSKMYGQPYPTNLIINESDASSGSNMQATDNGLKLHLPALKARSIDPLISTRNGIQRLSELEPTYMAYLAGQRTMMAKAYEATVLIRPDVAASIVDTHDAIDTSWRETVKRQRNAATLGKIIIEAEPYAAVHSFDVIHEVDDMHIAWRNRMLGEQGVLFAL